jgi:hypothetical protein
VATLPRETVGTFSVKFALRYFGCNQSTGIRYAYSANAADFLDDAVVLGVWVYAYIHWRRGTSTVLNKICLQTKYQFTDRHSRSS